LFAKQTAENTAHIIHRDSSANYKDCFAAKLDLPFEFYILHYCHNMYGEN